MERAQEAWRRIERARSLTGQGVGLSQPVESPDTMEASCRWRPDRHQRRGVLHLALVRPRRGRPSLRLRADIRSDNGLRGIRPRRPHRHSRSLGWWRGLRVGHRVLWSGGSYRRYGGNGSPRSTSFDGFGLVGAAGSTGRVGGGSFGLATPIHVEGVGIPAWPRFHSGRPERSNAGAGAESRGCGNHG